MNNEAQQHIKVAEFLPVLDQVIGFMTEALGTIDTQQTKIAQLEDQLKGKDKVILEKVAAAASVPPQPVFKDEDVQKTLRSLMDMNIIDQEMATKYAADIKADPKVILPLLTRISEALISAPPGEGAGIEKEAAADNDASDPDGWGAFIAGKPVKLKP